MANKRADRAPMTDEQRAAAAARGARARARARRRAAGEPLTPHDLDGLSPQELDELSLEDLEDIELVLEEEEGGYGLVLAGAAAGFFAAGPLGAAAGALAGWAWR